MAPLNKCQRWTAAEDNFQVNIARLITIFVVNLCSPLGLLLVCLLVTIDASYVWPQLPKNDRRRSRRSRRSVVFNSDWDSKEIARCCGLLAKMFVSSYSDPM